MRAVKWAIATAALAAVVVVPANIHWSATPDDSVTWAASSTSTTVTPSPGSVTWAGESDPAK